MSASSRNSLCKGARPENEVDSAGQADQCRCKAKLELQGGQEALFYLYRNGGSSYTNKSRSCEGGGFELQRRINCPVPLRAAHLSASVPISSKLTLQMPSLLPFGRTGGSFAELKWRIVLSGQGSSALQVRITGLLLQMQAAVGKSKRGGARQEQHVLSSSSASSWP